MDGQKISDRMMLVPESVEKHLISKNEVPLPKSVIHHRIANTMKRSSKMDPEIDHEDDYYLLEAIAKDRPKESICQPRIQATKD